MNIGTIVTQSLLRAQLPVADIKSRELAKQMLLEIIDEHWYANKLPFRISPFYLTTSDGVESYGLSKYVDQVVKNTMRGSDPIRSLEYEPSHEFYFKRSFSLGDGKPYYWRDGEYSGAQVQPSTASVITFKSSQSNYTDGTVTVVKGSTRILGATTTFTIDMIGRWFRVGSQAKRYKVISFESTTVIYLADPYEEASAGGSSYAIGDLQQKALVKGQLANGSVLDEQVQLNGSTEVSTVNQFASLLRISKSDKTHGYITATSNGGAITNLTLDPGETECDIKIIKLYPIPDETEQINFESYTKHPVMWSETDSPLFPSQWHPLLLLDLYIKIVTEFLRADVSQVVLARREGLLNDLLTRANDTDDWDTQQEQEKLGDDNFDGNLPPNFSRSVL